MMLLCCLTDGKEMRACWEYIEMPLALLIRLTCDKNIRIVQLRSALKATTKLMNLALILYCLKKCI